ncbi:MAG: AAA family ATPase [Thermoguttaceae bacterium]|nr:AAA family ATPase [Thermoguttaceae bacterium]
MPLKKLTLKRFTVFEELELEFASGINVFIGENGTGKTHVMKTLYAAWQAIDPGTAFAQKLVRVFLPDDLRIGRLVRRKQGVNDASVRVVAFDGDGPEVKIAAAFNSKTKKWDAKTTGEETWEKTLAGLRAAFIPAKEILSNAYNLNAAVAVNNVSFDDTYLDVANAAKVDVSVGKNAESKRKILDQIETIIEGKVYFDSQRDEFYLKKGNTKLEFNLIAEGIRKIALVWQLAKNGALEKGAVLFWDEPEANLNPIHIPTIVELLLTLQRNGVQIFIATHDYVLAKYLEIRAQESDDVAFFSLYKDGETVACERERRFSALRENPIMKAFDALLDEVYDATT